MKYQITKDRVVLIIRRLMKVGREDERMYILLELENFMLYFQKELCKPLTPLLFSRGPLQMIFTLCIIKDVVRSLFCFHLMMFVLVEIVSLGCGDETVEKIKNHH